MRDALRWSGLGLALAFLLHGADHLRRGLDASPPAVAVVGALQAVAIAAAVGLAWTGRRGAPTAAIVVGLVSILLVVRGHFVPGGLDSYATGPATNVTWLSWASAYVEIAGALAFATVGVLALRARRVSAGAS